MTRDYEYDDEERELDDNKQSYTLYENSTYITNSVYLGRVDAVDGEGRCRLEQKNKFSVGEELELMKPDGRNIPVTVRGIWDMEGNPQESCPHARQIIDVDLGMAAEPFDILRRCC